MKQQTLIRAIGILLVALGLIFPVDIVASFIVSLISPDAIVRPEWIADLARVKIVLIAAGAILFALTFAKMKFGRAKSQQQTSNLHAIMLIMLVISVLVSAHWVLRPISVNVGSLYQDDYFYYLKIAENAPKYGMVTFDGTNPSNGFQPLWFVVLIFLTWIIGSKVLLLNIAGMILAILHAGTAYMMYKILKMHNHETAGFILALFWSFNPFILWMVLAGFETTVYLFMMSLSLWYYLKHRKDMKLKQASVLGVLLGLTFMARLDAALFAMAVAVDYLFLNKQKIMKAFKRLIPTGIILAAISSPWFIFSLITSKSLTPLSGATKELVGFTNYYTGIIDMLVRRSFSLLAVTKHGMWFAGFAHFKGFVFAVAVAASWIALMAWLVRKLRINLRPVLFLFLFSAGIVGYYFLNALDIRYMMPVVLLGAMGSAIVLAKAYQACNAKKTFKILVAIFLALIAINLVISAANSAKAGQLSSEWTPLQYVMFNEGNSWLRANTAPNEVIGAFNAGVYAYFSGRKVVNLDGVINNNAYYALRDYRMYDYIREQNISYVIDWDYVEDYYLERFGPGDYRDHLTRVAVFPKKDEPHKGTELVVYRVN